MNNAKLWLVVKPTTGIPIFLSAVAIGSFAVHVAVLSNTSWVADFLSGRDLGEGDKKVSAMKLDDKGLASANLATVNQLKDGDRVTITLKDGTQAIAVIEGDKVVADLK